ncbi:PTS sugar transporter subunit IIA [Lactiplantibacillus plantarum]|uniref:PTS sugar transporter subunit IIA n=1 Tax=Lactiplantibacillus plantarum TaxID=1590 RepID=UPI0009781BB7|nr:PTS sugar transporter subunit IIA [Lactiplantibacillus plantarum]
MKSKIMKLVLWDSVVTTKKALFDQVATLLQENDVIESPRQAIKLWQQREKMGSTMIDQLLAAPHAQARSIKRNTVVLVHTCKPIQQWDEHDDAQNFIFCCIQQDISKLDVDTITRTLKLAISDDSQHAFQQNAKAQIIKILDF